MTCAELFKHIELWAPKEIAWQNDNVGLQVGAPQTTIKNIMLSLDLTDGVVSEALKQKCNLIITHHPLLFHPIRKIDFDSDTTSKLVHKLISNNITLYSAHTNLDFTKDGVSFQLAKQLELNDINFLKPYASNQIKIVVFIPQNFVEKVTSDIFEAGAGIIGDYSNCSFRINGEGTFRSNPNANPVIGKKGKFEKVDEVRIEIIADKWQINKIIETIKRSHPYEEPAFDIYPIENENKKFGTGAIGILNKAMNETDFLTFVSAKLGVKNLRFNHTNLKLIQKVAVCGGSGSDLLKAAIHLKADAFITADVRYHTFHDANNQILLIDAGHYETEIFVLDELKRRILKNISEQKIKIFKCKQSTNPIKFFNN